MLQFLLYELDFIEQRRFLNTRLVNIKNADGVSKLMDIVPDIVSRFTAGKDQAVNDAARRAAEDSEETF